MSQTTTRSTKSTSPNGSTLYPALAIVGAILPYVGFAQFVAQHEGNALTGLFVNGATTGLTLDLLVSSVVFWVFLGRERIARPWLYVLLNLLIGLSCALPLALWARGRLEGMSGVVEG